MKKNTKNMITFPFPKNYPKQKRQQRKHKNKIIHRVEKPKKMLFLGFKSNYSKKQKIFHQILQPKTLKIDKNPKKQTMIDKILKNRFNQKIYDLQIRDSRK